MTTPVHESLPTADITDPLLRRRIDEANHVGGNAFLLALAAWQRGLEVTFHSSFVGSRRFENLRGSGARGEFLSIGDGNHRHEFYRLLGDLTSAEASASCEVKPETRRRWRAAGVAIAPGVVATPGLGGKGMTTLLEHYPRARFVLKPLAGSLAQGVLRGLDADAVRATMEKATEPLLLEVAIPGTEFRVHVVGESVVAALIRRPASVVGDGRQTLEALIRQKEAARRRHSEYANHAEMLDDYARRFLKATGRALDAVPSAGECEFVSDIADTHEGGDVIEGLTQLSSAICSQCVAACRALGLPNAGLDLIVTRDASGEPKAVFLEANQNPYIRHLSCPMPGVYAGQGNRVAEALIDHYFPESRGRQELTAASFNFVNICQMLASGGVASVTLPTLGADCQHQRYSIPAIRANGARLQAAHEAALVLGLHVQFLRNETGDVTVDLVGPKTRLDELADRLS